jgi:UDP-2,3-diacylglucosamine pyrophosphatase LpxH
MDCGAWTTSKRNFGLLCGSYAFVFRLNAALTAGQSIERCTTSASLDNFLSDLYKNFSITQLFQIDDPGYDMDDQYTDRLFCDPCKIYIFIPDIHCALGQSDPCDGSYKHPENIEYLTKFLKFCKEQKAIVIQTGDFVDLWTTEALLEVYYTNSENYREIGLTRQVVCATDPIQQLLLCEHDMQLDMSLVLRDRESRLWVSAQKIMQTLEKSWQPIISCIDHYILGNHDWEMRFSQSIPLNRYFGDRRVRIHDSVEPWTGISPSVEVSHGHLFPKTDNDTTNSTDVNSAMRVRGKAITFYYARGKRGTPLSGPMAKDPDDSSASGWLAEKLFNLGAIEEHVDSAEEWVANKAADWSEFSMVRNGFLHRILYILRKDNPGYVFNLDQPDNIAWGEDLDIFRDNERVINWNTNQMPLKMPRLSKRLFVHSHTHTAQITRVKLTFDPNLK